MQINTSHARQAALKIIEKKLSQPTPQTPEAQQDTVTLATLGVALQNQKMLENIEKTINRLDMYK